MVSLMSAERALIEKQVQLLTPGAPSAPSFVKPWLDMVYDASSATWNLSGWMHTGMMLVQGLLMPLLLYMLVGGLQTSVGGASAKSAAFPFTAPACVVLHEQHAPSLLRVSELLDPYRLSNGTHTLMDGQAAPFEHARFATLYALSAQPKPQGRPALRSQLRFLRALQAEARSLDAHPSSPRPTPALDWSRMRHSVLPPDLWNPADTAGWIMMHERNSNSNSGGLPAQARTLIEMLDTQLTQAGHASRCFAPTRSAVALSSSGYASGDFRVLDPPASSGWLWTVVWLWNPLRLVWWLLRTMGGWLGSAWVYVLWKMGEEETVAAVQAAAKAASAAARVAPDSLSAYWLSLQARMGSEFDTSARQMDSAFARLTWMASSPVLNALIPPTEMQAAAKIATVIEYPAALVSLVGQTLSPMTPSLLSVALWPLFVRWFPACWYGLGELLSVFVPIVPWTLRVLLSGTGIVGLLQFLRAVDALHRFVALGVRAAIVQLTDVQPVTDQWVMKRIPAHWTFRSAMSPGSLVSGLWRLLRALCSWLVGLCWSVALTQFGLAYCFVFSWHTQLSVSCIVVVLAWTVSLALRIFVPTWALLRDQEQQRQAEAQRLADEAARRQQQLLLRGHLFWGQRR